MIFYFYTNHTLGREPNEIQSMTNKCYWGETHITVNTNKPVEDIGQKLTDRQTYEIRTAIADTDDSVMR